MIAATRCAYILRMSHAVSRLRTQRLATSTKPFVTRGSASTRCAGCRLTASHCMCALRPTVQAQAGMCLIMADIEPFKPSNTGWLIADLVTDTWAFGWSRVAVDPGLLALLNDPQWQPYVVFPGEYVAPERVVTDVATPVASGGKRPLFVLLDGTWSEARKMLQANGFAFNKDKYTDIDGTINETILLHGKYLIAQKGKKQYFLIEAV